VKFRVERDVLAECVAWASRGLPARPPVPVLAGLLVEAGQDTLTFSSFDYEISARVTTEADVADAGRVLVSGRLLADISRNLPARPVEVASDGARVTLTCGSARFTLLTLPAEDYPALPVMPPASGTVESGLFATAVAQVSIAAGRDDTLPVLTGVRVEIDGDSVTLAATDRYRLAVRELAWAPAREGDSEVALVPARTLADTARSLPSGQGVTIALAGAGGGPGEGLIGFESVGRRTTSRLLDGEFPKYRALLPTEFAAVAQVETAPFVEAVRRVALVAERNTPIRLTFADEEVMFEAGTSEDAQASEVTEARLSGEDIAIAFNHAFLLDGLNALDAPVAQLAFTTPTKPVVITGRPAFDEDGPGDYRYLLMPVRLSG
jgi:DNA polymerase III subunit beta